MYISDNYSIFVNLLNIFVLLQSKKNIDKNDIINYLEKIKYKNLIKNKYELLLFNAIIDFLKNNYNSKNIEDVKLFIDTIKN